MWNLYPHLTTADNNASQQAHSGILESKFLVTETCRIMGPNVVSRQLKMSRQANLYTVLQRTTTVLGTYIHTQLGTELTTLNYLTKRNRARSAGSYLQVQR